MKHFLSRPTMVDQYFLRNCSLLLPSIAFFFISRGLIVITLYLSGKLFAQLSTSQWLNVCFELYSLILWLLLYLCKLGHVPAPQFVNSSLKIMDMFFSLQFWSVQLIFCVMFFLFSNSTFVSSLSHLSLQNLQ